MEYILNSEIDGIDFDRYSAYVESIRSRLQPHIYAFASNPSYFDLHSHSSLHDAWLEKLTVRETSMGERNQLRQLEIHLCLLGPYHDRWIHLNYVGVAQYSIVTPPKYAEPRYRHTAHGDLLTHEIRLGQNGLLLHELLFERGSTLLIECADITHSEETKFRVGDKVKVVGMPSTTFAPGVKDELGTFKLFKGMVGRVYTVRGFDEIGNVELKPKRRDVVWIEPEFLRLRARKAKKSKPK